MIIFLRSNSEAENLRCKTNLSFLAKKSFRGLNNRSPVTSRDSICSTLIRKFRSGKNRKSERFFSSFFFYNLDTSGSKRNGQPKWKWPKNRYRYKLSPSKKHKNLTSEPCVGGRWLISYFFTRIQILYNFNNETEVLIYIKNLFLYKLAKCCFQARKIRPVSND